MELDGRLETLREYMLTKPGAVEEFPFGPEVMVIRVVGKIFGLIAWEENPLRISLKCDPERAVELRELYPGIIPGYHLNKQHWNTVIMDTSVTDALVRELMDHSYDLVVSTLSKAKRADLE